MKSLRERKELKFFAVLPKADSALAIAWWVVLLLRGVLPAFFGIAMGLLVAAVLIAGLLVAAVFLALAVRLRRYREPI